MHYERQRRLGSFDLPPRKTERERFESFVRKTRNGCWLWTGAIGNEYGHGKFGRELAHRAAWRIYRGPVPTGMNVLHKCDTPLCVNYLKCLFLGTQADNIRDCVAKARHKSNSQRGEACSAARLTERKVLRIRALHAGGVSQPKLARRYSVALSTIGAAVTRVTWKHI